MVDEAALQEHLGEGEKPSYTMADKMPSRPDPAGLEALPAAGAKEWRDLKDMVEQLRNVVQSHMGVTLTTLSHKEALALEVNKGLPTVTTREEFDALPNGAFYLDGLGIKRVK